MRIRSKQSIAVASRIVQRLFIIMNSKSKSRVLNDAACRCALLYVLRCPFSVDVSHDISGTIDQISGADLLNSE